MSEWWTYRLPDLILFSGHAYYRLIELYSAAIWPAQVLALALGAAILVLSQSPTRRVGRAIAAILAAGWLWIALAFHGSRYATLNTAAPWFGYAFALEAGLLFGIGTLAGRITFGPPEDRLGRAGVGLYLFALVVMPMLAPGLGRGWATSEVFLLLPDPTAVGTLGLLLLARMPRRWISMIVPALACAVTGAVLSVFRTPDFWVAPAAALLAVACAAVQSRRRAGALGSALRP